MLRGVTFISGVRRATNAVLKIVCKETELTYYVLKERCRWWSKFLPKCRWKIFLFFFLGSIVHSAQFRQILSSIAIMAADNHVTQFTEGVREDDFGQIIAEIEIFCS